MNMSARVCQDDVKKRKPTLQLNLIEHKYATISLCPKESQDEQKQQDIAG